MKLRVLLVEDESLVAILLEDMLTDLGCEVVEIASRLETGLAAAETVDCDVAVLDVNLGGGVLSFPIAEKLRMRGIPYLFATGYGSAPFREHELRTPVLRKPFGREDLSRGLDRVVSQAH